MARVKRTQVVDQKQSVDQTAAKRLATRLYVVTALLGLFLAAGLAHVGLTVKWNNDSLTHQASGETDAAIAQVKRADNWMPLQGWVTDYNLGTYLLAKGSLAEAITAFEEAELKAPPLDPEQDVGQVSPEEQPPMCRIRGNHVNAYLLGAKDVRATANDHVDSTKESFGEAGVATDKDAYDQAVADGEDTKGKALADFTNARDSYAKAAELLREFTCFDDSLATEADETVAKLEDRIDSVTAMEPPAWNPPNEDSGSEDDTPAGPDNQGQGDTESPEQTDSNDPEEDPNGQGTTDAPAFFDEDEQGRQELLHDRNKLGDTDREEADAANGSVTPSKKQW